MQSDPLCPACAEQGRLAGWDRRGREVFTCRVPTCPVIEYDAQVILRREGATLDPPNHDRRRRTGEPAYWRRD